MSHDDGPRCFSASLVHFSPAEESDVWRTAASSQGIRCHHWWVLGSQLHDRLSRASWRRLVLDSSKCVSPCRVALRHTSLSSAWRSRSEELMLYSLRALFVPSLYLFSFPAAAVAPVESSSYNIYFGSLSSFILITCPTQRRRLRSRSFTMETHPVLRSTSVLGSLSLHVMLNSFRSDFMRNCSCCLIRRP